MKKLYGIGVGPGDPELLTVKALRLIRSADLLVLPAKTRENCLAYRIAEAALPEIREKNFLCCDFPMLRNEATLRTIHQQIFFKLKDQLEQDKALAFLTLGDPSVYSTFGYIRQQAIAAGIPVEIVSGVPAFCGAANRLLLSLCTGREPLHILPDAVDIRSQLALPGTKVFLKLGRQLKVVRPVLRELEAAGKIQVMAVVNCGLSEEMCLYGAAMLPEDGPYLLTVIVKDTRKAQPEIQ